MQIKIFRCFNTSDPNFWSIQDQCHGFLPIISDLIQLPVMLVTLGKARSTLGRARTTLGNVRMVAHQKVLSRMSLDATVNADTWAIFVIDVAYCCKPRIPNTVKVPHC